MSEEKEFTPIWITQVKDMPPNKALLFIHNEIMFGKEPQEYFDYTVRVLTPISKHKYDHIKDAIEKAINEDLDWDKVSGQIYEYVKNGSMKIADLSHYLKHHFKLNER